MKKKSQQPMNTVDTEHNKSQEEAQLEAEVAQEQALHTAEELDKAMPEGPIAEDNNVLMQQLSELQEQLMQQKDATLRAHADLDNYRRRMMREKDELKKKITGDILESILPTIDTMKLGLETSMQQHPEAKGVIEGFQMVFNQFQKALESQGIMAINPEGEEFDPHQHECLAHQPHDDVAENHIMQVVRLGYKLNDRVLRPASVIVSSGPAQKNQQEEGNE